jgi:hypothetical protein
MIAQLALTALSFAILLYAWTEYPRSPAVALLAWLAALGGLYFVWVPSHATQLAALVGIGRGVDLIIYTWVGISLLVLLNLHLKLRSQMELITVLARELAIANARAGQFDERVALASDLIETAPLHEGRSLARNKAAPAQNGPIRHRAATAAASGNRLDAGAGEQRHQREAEDVA